MIYVGLTKGIINATAHWYLAVTEDGALVARVATLQQRKQANS